MTASPPFVDREAGEIDRDQILAEAIPLASLIGVFVALALIPFVFVVLIGGRSGLGMLFALASQFILAVGTGIVLMYVIARSIQLADT